MEDNCESKKPDHRQKWRCMNDGPIRNFLSCETHKILTLFGKNYILMILRTLLMDKRPIRFNELEKIINSSPKTLTIRLRELEEMGLITRTIYKEIPIRVEYELTSAGKDLEVMFDNITKWILLNKLKKNVQE